MTSADYVIVGAGSAGCVLAAKLSEDDSCEVALLEAGGEDCAPSVQQTSQWPLLWDSAENWGYSTTLQPGYNLRSIPCPRGKVLGGTSSINAMVYIRGDPLDFDHWRDLGNPGWGWSDVLPFFKKAEDQSRGPSAWQGSGGPLTVSDPVMPSRLALAFIEAAGACGYRRNPDFNGQYRDGAGLYQTTTRDGRRCSTAKAYLHPVRQRPNLRTITLARALRLLLAGDRAVGVEYFDGKQVLRIEARREVIVSAGAIDSPRLLMLSGIGDPLQLERHGIIVRATLPGVGRNLCDHPTSPLVLLPKQADQAPETSTLVEAGLFMKSKTLSDGFAADIQFLVTPYAPAHLAAQRQARAMSIVALACRPKSRGHVTLRSPDPFDSPVINPGYMTHDDDLALHIEGLRTARQIVAASPLREHIAQELSPGASVEDDVQLESAIRATSGCIWHPVGTCRMGTGEDAVVDAKLRVRGISNLRVVDASVMPQITSGNTNAPTIMIAERAADMIRFGQ
jgi:choline dehydrogenase